MIKQKHTWGLKLDKMQNSLKWLFTIMETETEE